MTVVYLSFENEDETYLSESSCYQSESEIEINSTESDEEGKSSDREWSEKTQQDLYSWLCYNRCSESCLNDLLVVLRRNGCVLLKDERTLLKTPTSVETKTMFDGSYIYLGIAAGFRRILGQEISGYSIIELSVNNDGLLLKESNPFVLAIYCGNKKS